MSKQPKTFEEFLVTNCGGVGDLADQVREITWDYIQKALEKSYMGDSGVQTAFKKEDIK